MTREPIELQLLSQDSKEARVFRSVKTVELQKIDGTTIHMRVADVFENEIGTHVLLLEESPGRNIE